MNEQIALQVYELSVGRYLNSAHVSSENQHNELILTKLRNEIAASSFGRRLLQTTHEVLVSPRIKLRTRFCSRHFLNLVDILRIVIINLLVLASEENHRTNLYIRAKLRNQKYFTSGAVRFELTIARLCKNKNQELVSAFINWTRLSVCKGLG